MIKKIALEDRQTYIELATEFYNTSAVTHNIPPDFIERTFEELSASNKYLDGYMFKHKGQLAGYALLAKTWSQEAGGLVVWVEEIYMRPAYQGKGLGTEFFGFLQDYATKNVARLRLEVEPDNLNAIKLYQRMGFEPLKYTQMVKEFCNKL